MGFTVVETTVMQPAGAINTSAKSMDINLITEDFSNQEKGWMRVKNKKKKSVLKGNNMSM